MGDDQWREADAWPPASTATSYYLVSSEAWGDSRQSCRRTHPREKKAFTSFVSDPAKPVVNSYSSSGAHDYRELAKRHDVLTFDSAPMERDTEVTGPIQRRFILPATAAIRISGSACSMSRPTARLST